MFSAAPKVDSPTGNASMRLAKLRIKGYRSVKKDETLVTDQRITILIGANDHGKSNLLAAIRCLNDDHPIKPDDRNWDLSSTAPVEIVWHFSADEATIQRLRQFAPIPESAPSSSPTGAVESESPTEPAVASVAAVVPSPDPSVAPAPPTAAQQPNSPTEGTRETTFPTNGTNEIVFSRDLATNNVRIVSLPTPVLASSEKEVLALRPRVELFESPGGNVIDQVNRAELETPSFEFMQGIFRLAGLWDSRDQIFVQNDTTSKQLKEASEALTKILNDQWNQGKDLKWIFEHTGTNGDTIVIKIEDPAIKGRYTRPSLRSSGFRTYFLLSMIIYARSQNTPDNSHIYLFDEPGTYLHPSAQLDLQRSFETIADQAQLAYTTHSLFLISKNYPARNRVVSKTISGTKIDQKPFSKNWKSVRQSLGILLSNNFLIAEKTLLVEGPSDAIYLLAALRKLKSTGEIDVDLNDMSIVDAGDSQNYVAMAKIMLSEGRSIVALADGDAGGKALKAQLERCCVAEAKSKKLQIHLLPDNKSSEDVFADLASLGRAVAKSFQRLVDDGFRAAKENMNIDEAVAEIKTSDSTTLGKSIEQITRSWFKPADKISKLLIAILYEDEVDSSQAAPPPNAFKELESIIELLELRSEKSKQSGVFEEVE
jgi:predicted ATP-dependent endonuclease of OLD family